jgi:hypothetical protein
MNLSAAFSSHLLKLSHNASQNEYVSKLVKGTIMPFPGRLI